MEKIYVITAFLTDETVGVCFTEEEAKAWVAEYKGDLWYDEVEVKDGRVKF